MQVRHLTLDELNAGLEQVRQSPVDGGVVQLIVRRPAIGSALIEITSEPHTGCRKFVDRFGMDAMTFVNSPEGKQRCLRGINTRVVGAGTIRLGNAILKR